MQNEQLLVICIFHGAVIVAVPLTPKRLKQRVLLGSICNDLVQKEAVVLSISAIEHTRILFVLWMLDILVEPVALIADVFLIFLVCFEHQVIMLTAHIYLKAHLCVGSLELCGNCTAILIQMHRLPVLKTKVKDFSRKRFCIHHFVNEQLVVSHQVPLAATSALALHHCLMQHRWEVLVLKLIDNLSLEQSVDLGHKVLVAGLLGSHDLI